MNAGADLADWVGYTLDAGPGDIACERGYILHWAEAVEDANPLWWDEDVADELTGGWIAPPSMLSVWMRPLMFTPGEAADRIRPLEVHFRLKDALGLPEGVVTFNELEFHAPVRPGDVIATKQTIAQISEPKTNRLGTGRYWRIDVTCTNQHGEVVGVETYNMFGYARSAPAAPAALATRPSAPVGDAPAVPSPLATRPSAPVGDAPADPPPLETLPSLSVPVTARTVVMGASASRDWQPQHHDHAWAMAKQGSDIFLNTPNQAGWLERYLTDWTGPRGRLGRMRFRMMASIQPGHTMVFGGEVVADRTDATGCRWKDVKLTITVDGQAMTTASARIAVPADDADNPPDNPWTRTGDDWQPAAPGDLP